MFLVVQVHWDAQRPPNNGEFRTLKRDLIKMVKPQGLPYKGQI